MLHSPQLLAPWRLAAAARQHLLPAAPPCCYCCLLLPPAAAAAPPCCCCLLLALLQWWLLLPAAVLGLCRTAARYQRQLLQKLQQHLGCCQIQNLALDLLRGC
jgi:hypothetical protein